jgi:lipopolysaccharide export system permease protein
MSLLDRYIARMFLTNVLTLLVILFCFVIAVDASINVDRFASIATRLLEERGEVDPGLFQHAGMTLTVIFDLWWPRLLQLYNFLIGLVMVGAMGFTCTQFVRNREFVAMLAAGQSLFRVARPVLLVAVGLTTLQALNQELVIPRIAPLLSRDHNAAGRSELGTTRLPLTPDGSGRLFRARSFDADSGVLEGLFVLEHDDQARPTRAIRAESAEWDGSGWVLTAGIAEPRTELGTIEPVTRIDTGLDPTQIRLSRFRAYRNSLGFAQAGQMLKRADLLDDRTRRELVRIRWGRFSVWISNILTLSIALPFFLTREPTSMIRQSLKCAPITITALMGGVLGSSAAIPGLPPIIGVFIPVMILLPASIAVQSSVKT